MPYRRLPNTDNARVKAMEIALKKGMEISPTQLAFSQSTLQKIKNTFPKFQYQVRLQRASFSNQAQHKTSYNYSYKKAKIYVSHFIQVLNLAILRGDLKQEARTFFQIEEDEKKLPILKIEEDLIKWGDIVLKGESERILKGGNPMTNPTIGIVKVHFKKFLELYQKQILLQKEHTLNNNALIELRKEIDPIIAQLWNEVESFWNDKPAVEKRNLCREYGLVYFFRPQEDIPEDENISDRYRNNRKLPVKKDSIPIDEDIIIDHSEITEEIEQQQFTLFD